MHEFLCTTSLFLTAGLPLSTAQDTKKNLILTPSVGVLATAFAAGQVVQGGGPFVALARSSHHEIVDRSAELTGQA